MKRPHNLYLLVSMVLLLGFAAGSFYVLSKEILAYQKMEETMQQQDDLNIPLAYLHTKLKANDQAGKVRVATLPWPCLIIEQPKSICYLYYRDGYLMELEAAVDYQPTYEEGNRLFAVDDFKIKQEGNLFTFTLTQANETQALSIYVHGEGATS